MQSAVITSPRWRKLGRDLWTEKNRMALMIVAISVSLIAVGTVLGSFAILTREIAVNYLGTRPASATVELEGDVDAALVERVRRHPAEPARRALRPRRPRARPSPRPGGCPGN